jgi:hypothetical protein
MPAEGAPDITVEADGRAESRTVLVDEGYSTLTRAPGQPPRLPWHCSLRSRWTRISRLSIIESPGSVCPAFFRSPSPATQPRLTLTTLLGSATTPGRRQTSALRGTADTAQLRPGSYGAPAGGCCFPPATGVTAGPRPGARRPRPYLSVWSVARHSGSGPPGQARWLQSHEKGKKIMPAPRLRSSCSMTVDMKFKPFISVRSPAAGFLVIFQERQNSLIFAPGDLNFNTIHHPVT